MFNLLNMKRDMFFPEQCDKRIDLMREDPPIGLQRSSSFHSASSSIVEEGTIVSTPSCLSSSSMSVPRSENSYGSNDVYPKRKERKRNTVMVNVGGLVSGPPGMIVGATVRRVITDKVCKAKEKRAQRRHEHRNFQNAGTHSVLTRGEFC
jgi:hypothetical protein